MQKIISKFTSIIMLAIVVAVGSSGLVFAGKPAPAPTLLGNDISWPQCNKPFPSGQAFGIVGVNNGLANNTNPCFARQLAWAEQSKGGTGQPEAALYVNTANPGLTGSWWPTSNNYNGTTVTSEYGTCDGTNTAACAYVYGYAKAYDNAHIRGVPNPASWLWWLDVETINSWEPNKVANAAALEGMTAYFQSIGARVGIYSTSYQWNLIVGQVKPTSNLNNLQSWIAGASSAKNAKAMCTTAAPLTSGSPVTVVQFVAKNLDYDYSCI